MLGCVMSEKETQRTMEAPPANQKPPRVVSSQNEVLRIASSVLDAAIIRLALTMNFSCNAGRSKLYRHRCCEWKELSFNPNNAAENMVGSTSLNRGQRLISTQMASVGDRVLPIACLVLNIKGVRLLYFATGLEFINCLIYCINFCDPVTKNDGSAILCTNS